MEMIGSSYVGFDPFCCPLFVRLKYFLPSVFRAGSLFQHNIVVFSPSYLQVVIVVIREDNHNFRFCFFVVLHCHVNLCTVAATVVQALPLFRILVSNDVEGIASCDRDVLVFGSMVDAVFPDELKRSVIFVFLEHSDNSFGERNTQTVLFGVEKVDFIGSI